MFKIIILFYIIIIQINKYILYYIKYNIYQFVPIILGINSQIK